MKINIGSTNKLKIQTVETIVTTYEILKGAQVTGVSADSGVSDQPHTLEETVSGAITRAKNAFKNCDLSFGLEGGLIKVPSTKTGFMKFEACAIYDGTEVHLGMSCGFEIPKLVFDLMQKEKLELSDACFKAGITDHPKVGTEGGIVNILTQGKITRQDQITQAVTMAMIHLENKNLFK